jgi:hypothetical protein
MFQNEEVPEALGRLPIRYFHYVSI